MKRDAAVIRSMFASIARRYDFLNHLLSLNQDKRWRSKTVQATASGSEKLVLDVCSGTGDLAIEYARNMNGAGLVVGGDFTPEMLGLGKRKLSGAGGTAGKVALVAADTLQLPFLDGAFDIVSVAFGIRNVSDLKGGIREMARVTRRGGKVVVLEFSLPQNKLIGGIYLLYFTRLLPLVGRMISRAGNDAYSYLPASVLKFASKEEMAACLADCGLVNISVRSLSLGIVTLYVAQKDS
ncbi:MAG: bifunctional demethylmenaquinone methyltransferase/2-methoxy-6-polyprenyl-1,4-benzoquinol methylase UbiE [Candidatus Abyssobacteria bacterium SURF_5]|uniref:Demethylmenaquinone methyltransferase n=1 Tax=Abyssobacteria bacterium (strain SURF_5) TaxID=2093360 RepID=A0A3A4NCB2_ABYX5|nr:MAG: bifunctional demethylmenaquinone methyltransferase/2-methoxy-6-polyprenyl-1,4-benzoquinol methylase UbiE [Candidatus Abyssubacteria bacterium SURF_5]